MNNLKTFIGEHKKAALVALFLLIVFIGGSVTSALNVAQHRAEKAAQTEAQEADKDESPASVDEDVDLTDSQKEAIEGYDDDTLTFIDTLSASVWSANNGRCTLRFADDSYVETVDGDATTHSYAIDRIDKSSDGYGGSLYTVVFETDTGTHVVTYTDGKGSAAQKQGDVQKTDSTLVASLSSASMFSLKDTSYERADPVEEVAIKGLNSEVTQFLGGDTDKLTSSISSWCAVHHPTASEATWSGSAFIDWENSLVSLDFTLNDDMASIVSAVYHTDTNTYEFDG